MGGFISTDPKDVFYNAYSYCGGNPITFVDPDGQNPLIALGVYIALFYIGSSAQNQLRGMNAGSAWNPFASNWWNGEPNLKGTGALNNINISAGTSGSLGFGGPRLEYNANAWLSVGNGNIHGFAGVGLYNNGPGTTSENPDKLQFDFTAGTYVTAGGGSGTGMPQYSLNYNSIAGINNYNSSLTYGQFFTYNSGLGALTQQGLIGARLGNATAYYHNDVDQYPPYSGGKGTDQGWTGGGGVSLNNMGTLSEYMTEVFTGVADYDKPVLTGSGYGPHGTYAQDPSQQNFNSAITFGRYNNGAQKVLTRQAWTQNYIHDYMANCPRFRFPDLY